MKHNICPIFMIASLCLTACVTQGCASSRTNREIISAKAGARDRPGAISANAKGVDALNEGKLERAESLLTEAIRLDITFAPAHNNLGALYLMTDRFYLAAWEFEYAAKLVPGDPRPRNNLGLVMETIGRLDSAIEHYDQAVKFEPDNAEYVGNLARTLSKSDERPEEFHKLLRHLILTDTRGDWRTWAERELIRVEITRRP